MNVLQLLFNFWKGKKSYMRSFLWDVTPVHYNYTFIPILFQGDLNVGHQDVERWRDLEGENGNIEKIQDKKNTKLTMRILLYVPRILNFGSRRRRITEEET